MAAPASASGAVASSATPAVSECLCVVCCEPIFTYCLGACDHRSLCMPCGLRLRTFFDDNRCPVCKVRHGVLRMWYLSLVIAVLLQ